MSELEKDIQDGLSAYRGHAWDVPSIARAVAKYLTDLGYTRTGLTDVQGVISITIMRGIINGFINEARCDTRRETAREILTALESMIGVGTGQPEKPVRRVVQWEYRSAHYNHDWGHLGKKGWELVCATGNELIFKRPIPGDDA